MDPRRGRGEAGDHSEKRRLSTAGWAEQKEEVSGVDLEGNVVHGDGVAEHLSDGIKSYLCHRSSSIPLNPLSSGVMTDPRLARLRRIAPYRRKWDPETSISGLVESTKKVAKRNEGRLSTFTEAWDRHVPQQISTACRFGEMRGGTITILVESSPAKYELDRLLKSGLEAELRRSYSGPLSRIRTKLSPAPDDKRST